MDPPAPRNWLLDNAGAFFDLYASQPRPFVDMPLIGDFHRGLSHLLGNLVVNLGLKRAKKDITSFQVRQLLVHSRRRSSRPGLGKGRPSTPGVRPRCGSATTHGS